MYTLWKVKTDKTIIYHTKKKNKPRDDYRRTLYTSAVTDTIDGWEKHEYTTPSDDEQPTGVRERLTAGRPERFEDGEKSARRTQQHQQQRRLQPFFFVSLSFRSPKKHTKSIVHSDAVLPYSLLTHGSPNNNNTVARLIKYAKNTYLSFVPSFYEVKPI